MKYKIEPINQDTIKITNHVFNKIEFNNTIIVHIPIDYISNVETYLEELHKALPTKNFIIVSDNVKFCELKRKK